MPTTYRPAALYSSPPAWVPSRNRHWMVSTTPTPDIRPRRTTPRRAASIAQPPPTPAATQPHERGKPHASQNRFPLRAQHYCRPSEPQIHVCPSRPPTFRTVVLSNVCSNCCTDVRIAQPAVSNKCLISKRIHVKLGKMTKGTP